MRRHGTPWKPTRYRRSWFRRALAIAIASLLSLTWPLVAVRSQPEQPPTAKQVPAGLAPASSKPSSQLKVGAYVTALDAFDMIDNHLSTEFFLWTRWQGDEKANPSDQLTVLNAPSDNNIDRFELLEKRLDADGEWRLYKVRSRLSIPWRLQSYPFDRHDIRIRIGPENPFSKGLGFLADSRQSAIDPELILYDWKIGKLSVENSAWSLSSNLGQTSNENDQGPQISIVPTLNLTIPIARRSYLALMSSFLGDFLAIGLCMLSLIIPHSRDDLILGAVFSAAGNSIFLAQLLPISALAGFVGQMQLIIYLGILYVVIADELLDRAFRGAAERILGTIRPLLLPSYVLGTLLAIYAVIPSDVLN